MEATAKFWTLVKYVIVLWPSLAFDARWPLLKILATQKSSVKMEGFAAQSNLSNSFTANASVLYTGLALNAKGQTCA